MKQQCCKTSPDDGDRAQKRKDSHDSSDKSRRRMPVIAPSPAQGKNHHHHQGQCGASNDCSWRKMDRPSDGAQYRLHGIDGGEMEQPNDRPQQEIDKFPRGPLASLRFVRFGGFSRQAAEIHAQAQGQPVPARQNNRQGVPCTRREPAVRH